MDYETLHEFIHKRMSMTHIYQPLMIKTLLESKDGTATVEKIARSFINEDPSYLQYYKRIVKRWPHKTLKKHNVVSYERGTETYTLTLDGDVSGKQRRSLADLCDLRLQEFIDRDPWIQKFRKLDQRSVSGSIRYDILSKSRGVCMACGIKSTEALLDIDHIIPVSRGGLTEPDNLQALCSKCNREKRNRDDMDFLREHKRFQFRHPSCGFCGKHQSVLSNRMAYAMRERAGAGLLVIPNRHVEAFVDLTPPEKQLCMALVDRAIDTMGADGRRGRFRVDGFDGAHDGHCRISVIPQ